MTKLFESVMLIEQTVKFVKDKLQKMGYTEEEIKYILLLDPSVYSEKYLENDQQKYQLWIQENVYNELDKNVDTEDESLQEVEWQTRINLKYHYLNMSKLKEEHKNIYNFKSIHDLHKALLQYDWYVPDVIPQSKTEKEKDIRNNQIIKFESNKYDIILPLTEEQQIKYGWDTKWCTQQTRDENKFSYYFNENLNKYIWYIINKEDPKEKYQFSFENKEFVDASDDEISESKLVDIFFGDRKLTNIIIEFAEEKNVLGIYCANCKVLMEYFGRILDLPKKAMFQQMEYEPSVVEELLEDVRYGNIKPDSITDEIQYFLITNNITTINSLLYQGIEPSEKVIEYKIKMETQDKRAETTRKYLILLMNENIKITEGIQLLQVEIDPYLIELLFKYYDREYEFKKPSEEVQLQQIKNAPNITSKKYILNIITKYTTPSEQVKRQQGITEAYNLFSGDII